MSVGTPAGEVRLGSVLPGEFGSFSDISRGVREAIIVHCLADDSGGEVYRVENQNMAEDPRHRLVPLDLFTPENKEAAIAANQRYERDIVTRSHQAGRLILTHVASPQNTR